MANDDYLNYYAAEVNDPDDNPLIGVILCTDKDSITAEYAIGGCPIIFLLLGMCCICQIKNS